MPVIMGTAGHIDHGKTTLVRALTGTDCDRLTEEKRRGITIELGFAELALPGGGSLSVVDVPGHEKFVRTMVAGAAGIDFVLLVVAATEGVMPQTREHLEICELLGIGTGLVALTKIDAVDEEMAQLAEDDVRSLLEGTTLEGAPIFPVSAKTGQGLDALIAALADLEASLAPVRSQDLFRLPVDRVFSLHGHGTVVTGTMIAGSVSVGDTVTVYPSGLVSKVRGLQSHNTATKTAPAGRRTALNLPDLAVEDIRKGDVVSLPETLFPSSRWVVHLTCLESQPKALRHRTEVHFHHGSREMQARLYFADRDRLNPGESCLCEVRFTEPAVAVFGDRCVIRSFSPLRTVAGGVVLNPVGVDMRRRSKGFADRCRLLTSITPAKDAANSAAEREERVRVQLLCTEGGKGGLSFALLRVAANLDSSALDKALAALMQKQQVFCFDKTQRLYVAAEALEAPSSDCVAAVEAFNRQNSALPGIKRNELASGWGKDITPKLAHFIIERLLKQRVLALDGEFIFIPGHVASFGGKDASVSQAISTIYDEAGLTPPNTAEVMERLGITKKEAVTVMTALRTAGKLVRVNDDIWYAAEHLHRVESALHTWFETHETIDLAGLKTIFPLSRKYLVALLEYFDARRVTIRVGDVRKLRKTVTE